MAIPQRFKEYEEVGPVVEVAGFGLMTSGKRAALIVNWAGENGATEHRFYVFDNDPESIALFVDMVVTQWPDLARRALAG